MVSTLRHEAQRLAAAYTPEAIETILELMVDRKVPAGVRRQCAMDLVSISGSMPTKEQETNANSQLTVNILKLGDASQPGFAVEVEELREVIGDIVDLPGLGSPTK